MNNIISTIFTVLLRRKPIVSPDGTKLVKWYQSETVLAGIAIGIQGLYFIVSIVCKQKFKIELPTIPDTVLSTINTMLGGTIVWGRITAESKVIK